MINYTLRCYGQFSSAKAEFLSRLRESGFNDEDIVSWEVFGGHKFIYDDDEPIDCYPYFDFKVELRK